MRYNKKNFKKFLKENYKNYNKIDFEACCDDLEKRYGETGTRFYELNQFETNSKRPECFYY